MKSLQNLFLLTALCLFIPETSNGATLQFVQDGWTFGGPLELSFTGEDSDLDGWIEQSELTYFKAVYGLPEGSSTEWSIYDIEPDGFSFSDPGNFLIFARNDTYSLVDISFEGEVLASVFDQFLFPIDETQTAPVATPEPEGLICSGLLVITGLACRKSRQKGLPS